jgi:hypothetical protein
MIDGCDAPHVGAILLLAVIVIIMTGCGSDTLRMSLPPLLATLDILQGALVGDVGQRWLATAGDRFPSALDGERSDYFLTGRVPGGEAEQFLGGVPEKVIWCPERWQWPRIAVAASGCL